MVGSLPRPGGKPKAAAGFTLVELMVTLALMAVLFFLAMYPMRTWLLNNQMRAVADSVQNGLRLAQAEAIRRSRTVVFVLTEDVDLAESNPERLTVTSGGGARPVNWALYTARRELDSTNDIKAELIETGIHHDVAPNARIQGPSAICFNSMGRLIARTNTGVGDARCTVPGTPDALTAYRVKLDTASNGARELQLEVSLGGQVRMCDPYAEDKSFDACKKKSQQKS